MRIPYIASALEELTPGAQFVLTGDTYADLEWLDESQTKPTESVLNTKVTELKNAEPMKLLRKERDRLIAQSDWIVTRAKETGTNIPAAWKTYRQALRDLPGSANPRLDEEGILIRDSVTWPTEPT